MSSGIFLQWQGRRCACLVSGLGLSSEEWRGVCCASPGSVALVARTYPRKGVECAALPRLCSADRADATEEWHGVCSPSHGSVALVARTQPRNGVERAAFPRLCGASRADVSEERRGVCSPPPGLWRWSRGRNRGMACSVLPPPGSVALVARTQPRNGVECAAFPPGLWRWSRGRNRGMAWKGATSPAASNRCSILAWNAIG